jgi:Glycosyl transferases group 1
MKKIVFLASGWGAKNGGVNSFNYDIACTLGNFNNHNIIPICVVEAATTDEIVEAKSHNVLLYSTKGRFTASNIIKILNNNGHSNISCWIGHDIITGQEANECRDIYKEILKVECISGVIHHMDYSSYYTSKTNDGKATLEKKRLQSDVFTNCDVVYAVGPFLKNSVENILLESDIHKNVIELIPGLSDINNIVTNSPFRALSYGRLGDEDEIIKQGKLAVAAFSKMCKDEEINDSVLTIIGIDNDNLKEKQKELYQIGFDHAGKLCNITGLPYLDRSEIYKALRTQSVSMMLSTHEGFGLAGWESISAEVPLILSVDTGLYKFLDINLGGAGTGCLTPVKITGDFTQDIHQVSFALHKIKNNLESARRDAQSLKRQLSVYSWTATVDQLISHILLKLNLNKLNSEKKVTPKLIEKVVPTYNTFANKKVSIGETKEELTSVNLATLSKPMWKHDLFFSTTTHLAHMISKIYYSDLHYIWCTPSFNPVRTNPQSANPYEIYKNYLDEVNNGYMGPTITKHKVGLINGVSVNRQKGIISLNQEQEILEIIYAAEIKHFKPIIYVIAASKVNSAIKAVPQSKKSDLFSQEFLLEQLNGSNFDIIDLN